MLYKALKRFVLSAMVIAICYTGFLYLLHVHQKATLAKLIDRVHTVTQYLQMYVEDNGHFPESLETLEKNERFDTALITPMADEKIEYFPPKPYESESNVVLRILYSRYIIEVTKQFDRRVRDVKQDQ